MFSQVFIHKECQVTSWRAAAPPCGAEQAVTKQLVVPSALRVFARP